MPIAATLLTTSASSLMWKHSIFCQCNSIRPQFRKSDTAAKDTFIATGREATVNSALNYYTIWQYTATAVKAGVWTTPRLRRINPFSTWTSDNKPTCVNTISDQNSFMPTKSMWLLSPVPCGNFHKTGKMDLVWGLSRHSRSNDIIQHSLAMFQMSAFAHFNPFETLPSSFWSLPSKSKRLKSLRIRIQKVWYYKLEKQTQFFYCCNQGGHSHQIPPTLPM